MHGPETGIIQLLDEIAYLHTEQDAVQYLATLATVQIASRAQMPSYTTMVQHFLGTLQLPMAIYMLDYYLPMLSPNDGYNETGLTMQSAGPIREAGQPIRLSYLFKGSEFGHWKVTGGYDTFAFRHPSLGGADVRQLLESEAHHHKICPIGTGRLIAMVGTTPTEDRTGMLQVLFGLVLSITPKNEQKQKLAACSPNLPPMQSQSHRSCMSDRPVSFPQINQTAPPTRQRKKCQLTCIHLPHPFRFQWRCPQLNLRRYRIPRQSLKVALNRKKGTTCTFP